MASRPHNFNAGPAILPLEVMEEVRDQLLETNGTGLSVMEWSHRSPDYEAVRRDTEKRFLNLLGLEVDGTHEILFLQGGASLQFVMVPMNFAGPASKGDYVLTGSWSKKALAEAEVFDAGHLAWTGADQNFGRLPKAGEWKASDSSAYVHVTSNNTIFGTQFRELPDAGDVPLVVDASSDVLSGPIDMKRVGLLYAGAQKNLGPAGVTAVVIRKDMLEREPAGKLPKMLDYRAHLKASGLYNTPPTFAVWLMGKTLAWIEKNGGLEGVQRLNQEKAKVLYDAIDGSDFWRGTAAEDSRSWMNVTFRSTKEDLEPQFLAEAKEAGFIGLKGHRSVGGCRASIYNACPKSSIEALAGFMADFASKHG